MAKAHVITSERYAEFTRTHNFISTLRGLSRAAAKALPKDNTSPCAGFRFAWTIALAAGLRGLT